MSAQAIPIAMTCLQPGDKLLLISLIVAMNIRAAIQIFPPKKHNEAALPKKILITLPVLVFHFALHLVEVAGPAAEVLARKANLVARLFLFK